MCYVTHVYVNVLKKVFIAPTANDIILIICKAGMLRQNMFWLLNLIRYCCALRRNGNAVSTHKEIELTFHSKQAIFFFVQEDEGKKHWLNKTKKLTFVLYIP